MDENQVETPSVNNQVDVNSLNFLDDVFIVVSVEIGRTKMKIRDLLNLGKNTVIDLNKLAGDPVDIYANNKLIAHGNIITVNGKFSVKLSSIPNINGE